MEFILGLLDITWVFWLVLGVVSLFGALFATSSPLDDEGVPPITFVASILLLVLLSRYWNVSWHGIANNVVFALAWVVGYLVLGILWATFKWTKFVYTLRNKIVAFAKSYAHNTKTDWELMCNGADLGQVGHAQFTARSGFIAYESSYWNEEHPFTLRDALKALKPKPSSHKAEITQWILCWPVSILAFAIRDLVKDLIDGIFNCVRDWFQRISDRAFNKALQ